MMGRGIVILNMQKILFSLLKEISNNNYPSRQDYGISLDEFGEVVEMAVSERFIEGASVIRGGKGNCVKGVLLKGSKITLEGQNYLSENSVLAKIYKGIKEIKDWIKF
jgi:hypothetical protein